MLNEHVTGEARCWANWTWSVWFLLCLCCKRGPDCRCAGCQRMPLRESSSVVHEFDHQAPSSVTNGPLLQVGLSLTCPVLIKKKVVPFHVLGAEVFQLEIQISIWDPVILKGVDWNLAKSEETMATTIELSSLKHLLLRQTWFHLILLHVYGGDWYGPYFQMRWWNFRLVLRLVIVGTRTRNRPQPTGSGADLLLVCLRLCPGELCDLGSWSAHYGPEGQI